MLNCLSAGDRTWDVVVIGGGATGLGTALDAAARGYQTALLEAHDFAKGTSSRSTKLIHGGVRYLRQGQIRMVRESLHERGRLQRNASHIVSARSFVIPSYQFGGRGYYYAGMKAYDLLAGRLGFEPARLLSTSQTIEALPTLNPQGLRGGVRYSDGQFDDARLAVTLAQSLVDHGGVAVNYAPVVRLLTRQGRVCGVVAREQESGNELTLKAKVVINATGVFAESVMELDDADTTPSDQRPQIVASQGTHLVLPPEFLPSDSALLIPHTDDARVLFAIPWHGRTLLGTTDHRVEQISLEPKPLEHEVDYLLEHAGRIMTKQPSRSDILSVFAGLRPLVGQSRVGQSGVDRTGRQATSKLSREHEIRTASSGLITVIGGKWTTYRKMGQDVIDIAIQVGGLTHRASPTASLLLHGSSVASGERERSANEDPLAIYGTERNAVLETAERDREYAQPLRSELPYLVAQVVWAVEHEMARTVEDVLARRLRALLLDARASMLAAETTATVMQVLLQKDDRWRTSQIAAYCELAENYRVT